MKTLDPLHMNKEKVYDAEISPLMATILEICKTHKIAMIASFAIPTPGDETLTCTSALATEEYAPPSAFLKAAKLLVPAERRIRMTKMTVEKADGSKEYHVIATDLDS